LINYTHAVLLSATKQTMCLRRGSAALVIEAILLINDRVRSKIPRQLRIQVLWTLDMKQNPWARLLAYVTGLINQELLLNNE